MGELLTQNQKSVSFRASMISILIRNLELHIIFPPGILTNDMQSAIGYQFRTHPPAIVRQSLELEKIVFYPIGYLISHPNNQQFDTNPSLRIFLSFNGQQFDTQSPALYHFKLQWRAIWAAPLC
jgi:hypothetical protein